jgi:hypothetical protein
MAYSAAYASAQTLLHEINTNKAEPAYAWANHPVVIKELNDALDGLTTAMRANPLFNNFIGGELKALRAEATKQKTKDLFDRAIQDFPGRVDMKVADLIRETRLLNSSIQARIKTRQDEQDARDAGLRGEGAKAATSSKRKRKGSAAA